jgi:predicted Fe-S protein YdhL (DUF1289 family)
MTKYKNPCIMVCKYGDDGLCIGCLRTKQEVREWPDYDDEKRKEVYQLIIRRGGNPYKKKRYNY